MALALEGSRNNLLKFVFLRKITRREGGNKKSFSMEKNLNSFADVKNC